MKSVIVSVVIASIVGIGGAVASHERELGGVKEKLDAVHEDVKVIKELLLKKAIED